MDQISQLRTHIAQLEQEKNMLQLQNKHLSKTVDELLANQFGITKFMGEDSDINFYTSFPNYQTLLACYNFLNPGENGENIVYITSANDELEFPAFPTNEINRGIKPGRRRKLSTLDEFYRPYQNEAWIIWTWFGP